MSETAAPLFTNSIGMEFILIPAGTFVMGSLDSNRMALDWEKPAHQVTIRQTFYLGKYPVTQTQWQAVMGSNPSQFKGENRPVENMSWEDVQAFMLKLNEQENGCAYRLPTEAEWEYACRAGTTSCYSFGDDAAQLSEYAWYEENSDSQTHLIGQKKPNAWGLYDMHGNVWEWCQDWYGLYSAGAVTDPTGPTCGKIHVLRGGAWTDDSWRLRSASRFAPDPEYRYNFLGFRLAQDQTS